MMFLIYMKKPKEITRSGKNTSMALGLSLLAEGKGDAFVSAGSTGALVMGATFIVKRIKGIKRIAPSPVMPADKGNFILTDAERHRMPSGNAGSVCRYGQRIYGKGYGNNETKGSSSKYQAAETQRGVNLR